MFRKTLLYALAVALVAFVMTAQAADESQQLRIGAVMPLTGALQAYGETSVKGIKLAVEEINEAGGVLGEPIELEVADAQTKPQAGVEAANKLVNIDGVHAIIGAMGSGVAIPIALSVAKPSKVPQISPSATSPEVTTLDDDGFMFRTTASDAFQGVAMAQAAMEHGVDKTAVIYVNNDYGKGLADSFTEEFEAMGGEVTNTVAYEEKQASYRSALQKLWGDGSTQNLVVVAYVDDGETVLRQSLEGAMFDNFILSDGMKSKKLIEDLGADVMAGNIGTDAQPPEGSEAAERMKQAYADKYGENPPEPYIDNSYDAVYLFALAAQKAGSTDGEAIRDALREVSNPPGEEIIPGEWAKALELLEAGEEVNWTGAGGDEDFDENGDISSPFAVWQYTEEGTIETLRVFDPAKE